MVTLKEEIQEPLIPAVINEIQAFLKNRRRQLQDWEANPPTKVSYAIFGLVLLELGLCQQLTAEFSNLIRMGFKMLEWGIYIIMAEAILTKITSEFASFFKKKGESATLFNLLHIGLLPLLLLLPLRVLANISSSFELLALIFALFLVAKVLANWRETIEITFELNRWQSLIVFYGWFFFVTPLFIFIFYVKFLTQLFS